VPPVPMPAARLPVRYRHRADAYTARAATAPGADPGRAPSGAVIALR
jgi:hypothetical protein